MSELEILLVIGWFLTVLFIGGAFYFTLKLDQPSVEDEFLDWCDANEAILSKYKGCFLAIDIKTGVVFSSKDPEEFIKWLEAQPTEKLEVLYRTHGDLYAK